MGIYYCCITVAFLLLKNQINVLLKMQSNEFHRKSPLSLCNSRQVNNYDWRRSLSRREEVVINCYLQVLKTLTGRVCQFYKVTNLSTSRTLGGGSEGRTRCDTGFHQHPRAARSRPQTCEGQRKDPRSDTTHPRWRPLFTGVKGSRSGRTVWNPPSLLFFLLLFIF